MCKKCLALVLAMTMLLTCVGSSLFLVGSAKKVDDGFTIDNPEYPEGYEPVGGLKVYYYQYEKSSGYGSSLSADQYTFMNSDYMNEVNVQSFDSILSDKAGQGDGAAARFVGKIRPNVTGSHTFYMKGDNGFVLTINGQKVIDHWVSDYDKLQTGTPITLEAGKYYDIQIDYFEDYGGSNLYFYWDGGDGSDMSIVPSSVLFRPYYVVREEDKTWQKKEVNISTVWYDEISAGTVPHDVYPNPQLERADWMNLNGLWNFAGNSADFNEPSQYETQIMVPYPMESALSGVMQHYDWSWYNRTFTVPADWNADDRVILHFEAVDWKTVVYVNGTQVAENESGYLSFSADITDALVEGENQLSVKVYDNADAAGHTIGKQKVNANGIYYTQCSGIWGTVWMEPVSADAYVSDIKIDTDVDNRELGLAVAKRGSADATVDVTVKAEDRVVTTVTDLPVDILNTIEIPESLLYLWSPDSPFLYDLLIELKVDGKTVDTVQSYFGMRKIEVVNNGKTDSDNNGKTYDIQEIYLNGEPIYQMGFLDQGYFPESNYTAPTDEALRQEIQNQKDMGYNMVRKHIKVESKRWYYYCDKLGLLVWQDFVNGNSMDFESFAAEGEEMIRQHWNHPSIVMWILYNESWGQHDQASCQQLVDRVRALDPSRLISIASGWIDYEMGDIIDNHAYPGPWYNSSSTRARVNGEFGGLQYVVQNHLWSDSYWDGYTGNYGSPEALLAAYQEKIAATQELKDEHGLQGSVYTQYTDVEGELNGLMTYDRKVLKVDWNGLFITNQNLINDSQVVKTGLQGALTRVSLKDSSLYTEASWSSVLTARDVARAILAKEDATQTEVYQAQQKLLEALEALVGVDETIVDKAALSELFSSVQDYVSYDYSEDSWTPFSAARKEAARVISLTAVAQEDVDAAYTALDSAVKALEKVAADKEELDFSIEDAESYTASNYTTSTWAVFAAALETALAVQADETATQSAVDSAAQALDEAVAGLLLKVSEGLDRTALDEAVVRAQALVSSDYTVPSWTAVTTAVGEAEALFGDVPFVLPTLLQNGGFENGGTAGWDIDDFNSCVPQANWAGGTLPDGGNYCLKFQNRPVGVTMTQTLTGLEDGDYILALYIRGQVETNRCYLTATVNGTETKSYIPEAPWNATWHQVSMTVTVTGGTAKVGFTVEGTNNNEPNIDYVTFVSAEFSETAAKQANIDAAAKKLNDAIDALEKQPVSTATLDTAIGIAGTLTKDNYTETSWSALQTVLADATAAKAQENVTQATLDEWAETLYDAIYALERTDLSDEADRIALDAAIVSAEAITDADTYTEESWADLQTALAAAKAVGLDADQATVDAAAKALKDAIDALEEKPVTPAYTPGDVNNDGSVDSKDARLVLQYTVELAELDETQQLAANLNGDEAIDSKDARAILQAAVAS